jgi:hypothetical protein
VKSPSTRSSWSLVALLALSCAPRQSGEQSEVTPGTAESADSGGACVANLPSAIGTLEPSSSGPVGSCGVSIEVADRQLTLRAIPRAGEGLVSVASGVGEVLASGPIPEPCGDALERCELWGVHDELGPVLLVAVRGHESEVPIQVYVGWVEEQRLAFAPSWYGLSSIADHTRVGPPWALAPFACGGQLTLLPAARLPEAVVEGPSEAVRAAAGRWTIAADGSASPNEPIESDSGCRPVFTALP